MSSDRGRSQDTDLAQETNNDSRANPLGPGGLLKHSTNIERLRSLNMSLNMRLHTDEPWRTRDCRGELKVVARIYA
jgi:hypothetical protein